jgi:hypothetical protein
MGRLAGPCLILNALIGLGVLFPLGLGFPGVSGRALGSVSYFRFVCVGLQAVVGRGALGVARSIAGLEVAGGGAFDAVAIH